MNLKKIDLKDLPKAIWVSLAVIAANLGGYALLVLPMEEEVATVSGEATRLESKVRQLKNQANSIRRDVRDVTALQGDYDKVVASGFTQPQNRLEAVKVLQSLQQKHRLEELTYKFDEEYARPVDAGGGTISSDFELVYTPIELSGRSLLDSDLYGFWNEVLTTVPAHYRVNSVQVKRLAVLDRDIINQLRVGKSTALVEGELRFEWISLRKKAATPVAKPAAGGGR